MSDLTLHLSIKEETGVLFKRSIRKLMESTFLLRDKDGKLYDYASKESNRQDMSDYLRMIGFDVLVDDRSGVCMLIQSEQDDETVGLKRANVVSFTMVQYHMLLVLWKAYLELVGLTEAVFVTKGEIIDKLDFYGVTPTKPELAAAFKLFKKYSLTDYSDEDAGADARIRLYPSLQFGWDLPQLETVVKEYLKAEPEKPSGEGTDEESGEEPGEEPGEESDDEFGEESDDTFGEGTDDGFDEETDDGFGRR